MRQEPNGQDRYAHLWVATPVQSQTEDMSKLADLPIDLAESFNLRSIHFLLCKVRTNNSRHTFFIQLLA